MRQAWIAAGIMLLGWVTTRDVAAQTLNLGMASEFAGFGAGLEWGVRHRLALGTGVAVWTTSRTNGDDETHGAELLPGVGLGYRRYLHSGWFLGPTASASRAAFKFGPDLPTTWFVSTTLDAGYRWLWSSRPGWNTRLGLGGGLAWHAAIDQWIPAVSLTLSVGCDLLAFEDLAVRPRR